MSLPFLCFFLVVAILVGGAAGVIASTWIQPMLSLDTATYVIDRDAEEPQVSPDPRFVRDTQDRLVTVYDAQKKVDERLYPEDARVGEAVLFSSDGWAMLPATGVDVRAYTSWEGVDVHGNVHVPEVMLEDPLGQFVFVKFADAGFSFALFPQWNDVGLGNHLWAYGLDGSWRLSSIVAEVSIQHAAPFLLSEPQAAYVIEATIPIGSVLFTPQGRFFGVVGQDGVVQDTFFAHAVRTQLFSSAALTYVSVPWEATYVDGFRTGDVQQRVFGFYLNTVGDPVPDSVVTGDVLTHINGRHVERLRVWHQLVEADDRLTVTVLRDGEFVDVVVEKVPIE